MRDAAPHRRERQRERERMWPIVRGLEAGTGEKKIKGCLDRKRKKQRKKGGTRLIKRRAGRTDKHDEIKKV